ncbi:MAG TPA: BatA domain-containing protein, partial [Gemmataceae bacterium]|nr:BatA domain-containing protein [Gemmataceae bacterium]
MAPVLLYPLALFGLLGVPVLLAIYLLRNRYRRVPVSSLMLWVDVRQSREGGTRVQRLQTPLLLFLEVLAVALLALAAAGPHVRTAEAALPLVVVLDDSFSMLAGSPDSPRSRADKALEEELRQRPPYSVRFVLAGERPQALGEAVRGTPEALAQLDGWTCRAPAARLEEAAALAAEVSGEWARVLVLTDHAPESPPGKGRLQWWAFGRPLPNLAFVNAARSAADGGERCLFEVANLSDDRRSATLVVETGE